MTKSIAARAIAAAGILLLSGNAHSQVLPPMQEDLEAFLSQSRERAVAAADAYAAALVPDRNSPEFSSVFRSALNESFRDALTMPGRLNQFQTLFNRLDASQYEVVFGNLEAAQAFAPPLRAMDFDPRYRTNLLSLVRGGVRIWGGLPTRSYANTVMVTGGTMICTGTVIASNAVLTAQHCHCDGANQRVSVGYEYDDTQPSYRVRSSVPMKACSSARADPADVALLLIDGEFPGAVEPARFASSSLIDRATSVRAVGFGRTERGVIGVKMMVDIPVTSAACMGSVEREGRRLPDAAYYGCIAGAELVAGAPALDKDTCKGDSGGPVFVIDENGGQFLAGATSRAVEREGLRTCGDGGIYVRIDGGVRRWLVSQGVRIP